MGAGELARAPKASCFKQVVSNYQKARRLITQMRLSGKAFHGTD